MVPQPAWKQATHDDVRAKVDGLLGRMTLDEKVGQMTLVDRDHLETDDDIADRFLGALLSGGDSAPDPPTAKSWADTIEGYQSVAASTRLGIPLLYGIDAVHGAGLVEGATVFPHNIGLGAARDADLVRRIGEVTAKESAAVGVNWTFAPCLAVARDPRWGRTYESFGQDPQIVSALTTYIEGVQGSGVLATAKHWVGDGATEGGVDRGDAAIDEDELRWVDMAPYVEAVRRGVGAVMVSFSSWKGEKLHGHRYLVTDVLKGELGFGGIVVSDWKGLDELAGDHAERVRSGINAGIDMAMVVDDYAGFQDTLRDEVEAGRVRPDRIDDAVRRILTQKVEIGVFEEAPAARSLLDSVGSAEHREVAREAVRQSLVLLKNEGVLPLSDGLDRVLVAGKNADDLGHQCGGWTMGWQGGSGDVTSGTTILDGIREAVASSTTVMFEEDAEGFDDSCDVAIAVVGERPYAEGKGDRSQAPALDREDVELLERLSQADVATVAILVSGRPLVLSDLHGKTDALVAAWLPGTEGGGVADVLFGGNDFVGTLPRDWPERESTWPRGFGMRYG